MIQNTYRAVANRQENMQLFSESSLMHTSQGLNQEIFKSSSMDVICGPVPNSQFFATKLRNLITLILLLYQKYLTCAGRLKKAVHPCLNTSQDKNYYW